jgi:hypothetical protein
MPSKKHDRKEANDNLTETHSAITTLFQLEQLHLII